MSNFANQTIEPPEVQNWWNRKSDDQFMEPSFVDFHRCFIVKGPEADNQFCCLYVVFKQGEQYKEYLIVVAESVLQKGYYTGTRRLYLTQIYPRVFSKLLKVTIRAQSYPNLPKSPVVLINDQLMSCVSLGIVLYVWICCFLIILIF
jgi:hypothetical protein